MKTRFIVNPCSGRNRRRPWLAGAIRDFARLHLQDSDVVLTEGPGHATDLARHAVAAGSEVVVAVGGDGTMNEVAQALIGTPAALALVPCGSGNGLALHLGLPRTLRGALRLIADGAPQVAAIDTGLVGPHPFFNAMGVGFDAEVSRRFNGLTRRGLPAYVRAVASLLRSARPEHFVVQARDERMELDSLLIAVANSDQYGNNARIAPGASVHDGLLNLVAINTTGWLGLAALLPRLFAGSIDRSPRVLHLRAREFTIHRAAAGLIHTDGETHEMPATIRVSVNPASLRVIVPAGSRVPAIPFTYSVRGFALQLP